MPLGILYCIPFPVFEQHDQIVLTRLIWVSWVLRLVQRLLLSHFRSNFTDCFRFSYRHKWKPVLIQRRAPVRTNSVSLTHVDEKRESNSTRPNTRSLLNIFQCKHRLPFGCVRFQRLRWNALLSRYFYNYWWFRLKLNYQLSYKCWGHG